jgi:predicted ArsR family transcriptional regulator
MWPTRVDRRFSSSTRGQIALLLRRAARTVNELAQQLDLTDNAVRAHLATLERDGLVAQEGLRRGASKPSYAYHLTTAGEDLFPKAYGLVLRELLDVMSNRLPPEAITAALRETGARLAAAQPIADAAPAARVERAVALLGELGGLAEATPRADGGWTIQGFSCPLAAAVPGHPEVCALAEQLLASVTGLPVSEHCERGDRPCCRFEVAGD